MPKYGHDIRIREVLNGFIVKVGCEYVVIEGLDAYDRAIAMASVSAGVPL